MPVFQGGQAPSTSHAGTTQQSQQGLPFTGAWHVISLAMTGLTLLGGGAAALLASRRRQARQQL